MMPFAIGAALVVVVGCPALTAPTLPIWLLAGSAGLLCLLGIIIGSMRLTAAGATLALIGYATALYLSPTDTDQIAALLLGLALTVVVDGAAYRQRGRNARVDPAIATAQLGRWASRAAIIGVAAVLLIFAAAIFAPLIPAIARPFVTGAGAVIALAAATSRFRKPEDL
jgi:hypothetical protein